jgi:porin
MSIHPRLAILAAGVIAFPTMAWADDQSLFGDTLTGDWGGLRSRLHDDGVDLSLGYTQESAFNAQGGVKAELRYTDQFSFGSTFDLQKLLGLDNAWFQVSITDRNGRNLSSDAQLGSLQQVQEVFGRGQTWRVTQFWYDQTYFDNELDWKIGRLTEGEDFASFSCNFMNLTFCGAPPGNIVGSYWYNWPVSQWATRVKATLPDFGYVQLGAYQVNPAYLTSAGSFNLGNPPGTTGALIPFEIGWLPTFGGSEQLKGSYKLGAWYNTSQTADAVENTQGQLLAIAGGQPLLRNGAYGWYLNFLQKLTNVSPAEPDRGVSAFLNITYADRRTATLDNQIALGLFYTGPFDSRPTDQLGFAIGRTHVNGRVTDSEESQNAAGLAPVGVQHSEYAGEIYYSFHVAGGFYLQPNVQYVHQPGGIAQTADVILGLKGSLNF